MGAHNAYCHCQPIGCDKFVSPMGNNYCCYHCWPTGEINSFSHEKNKWLLSLSMSFAIQIRYQKDFSGKYRMKMLSTPWVIHIHLPYGEPMFAVTE